MPNEMLDLVRLNPLADVVFSCIFQNKQGAPAMKELINAVLLDAGDEPIEEIVDMKSQYPQLSEHPEGKSGRLDVKVRIASGALYDVEVQLEADSYFVSRELFYGETISLSDFKAGQSYQDLKNVKVIAFLDFILRNNNPDIVQPIKPMYTKEPIEVATDKLAFYNVEVPKFQKAYNSLEDVSGEKAQSSPLLQWLYLLTKGYQSKEEMDMLRERTTGMENFTALYTAAIADPTLRARYEYEMSQRLEEKSKLRAAKESGLAEGIAKGLSEGIAKGRTEGISQGAESHAKKMAAKLFLRGASLDEIADFVEFPKAIVKTWLPGSGN